MRGHFFALFCFSLLPIFVSCVSTRVYVRTNDEVYEDEVLISKTYKETLEGKEKQAQKTFYHDLSNAGFIVTDSKESFSSKGNTEKAVVKKTAHSFTAERSSDSKSSLDTIVFSLIETVSTYTFIDDGGEFSSSISYTTNCIGKKSCKIDKTGKIVSGEGTSSGFTGDTFSAQDEELFLSVLSLSMDSIAGKTSDKIVEAAGKSYKTSEKIEEISVESYPNGEYIFYSIAGKPFVILGSSLWNLIKCLGYAFYNFSGGYSLLSGTLPEGMSPWKMPSIKTAQQKFSQAKEANKIKYYPEYHLPFTNNTIKVQTVEQESLAAFITAENVEVKRTTIDVLKNTLSVQKSVSSDATYTAGVVGVIGTAVTIPVSVVTWIGGAGVAVLSKIYQ